MSLTERLGNLLNLDSEQREYLANYEQDNGEDGLRMLVRDAIESKRVEAEQDKEDTLEMGP